jgi:hypothetical protein
MQRRTRRLIGAVALIAALAAGGAAYTASNTLSTSVAGYGNVTVTGDDVSDISNVLSADGQNIDTVNLTFATPVLANQTVTAGFGPTASTAPTTLPVTCTAVGSYPTAAFTCDFTGAAPTATSNDFAVAVVH